MSGAFLFLNDRHNNGGDNKRCGNTSDHYLKSQGVNAKKCKKFYFDVL